VEFVTDPEVPPLPPHIRFDHVRQLGHTLAPGDSAAPRFVRQSLRGKLAELITR
jgi:pyruvate dehydrogenase (quinone)